MTEGRVLLDEFAKYMRAVDLDLVAVLEPPKEVEVEVEVLADVGDVDTENGTIAFSEGTRQFANVTDRARRPPGRWLFCVASAT